MAMAKPPPGNKTMAFTWTAVSSWARVERRIAAYITEKRLGTGPALTVRRQCRERAPSGQVEQLGEPGDLEHASESRRHAPHLRWAALGPGGLRPASQEGQPGRVDVAQRPHVDGENPQLFQRAQAGEPLQHQGVHVADQVQDVAAGLLLHRDVSGQLVGRSRSWRRFGACRDRAPDREAALAAAAARVVGCLPLVGHAATDRSPSCWALTTASSWEPTPSLVCRAFT